MTTIPAIKVRWRQTPQSSNVTAVGWDHRGHMYVEFNDGRIYMYEGVPRQRVVACSRAKSVGRYFNRHIKSNYHPIQVA
jgi:hypothetical protein